MAEWKKREFLAPSSRPRRVISRLNQFSERCCAQISGSSARDEDTTQSTATTCCNALPHRSGHGADDNDLNVDLRDLFVMAAVSWNDLRSRLLETGPPSDAMKMMDIAARVACLSTKRAGRPAEKQEGKSKAHHIEQVSRNQRVIIIGAPGRANLPFRVLQLANRLATEAFIIW